MATSKDLLAAEAFHRRRLVAALLSGSSYAEPPGVLRAVVAGVLAALALACGVLAAGYLGARS